MAEYSFGSRVIKTSSDDRVVFPDAGYTKVDVVDYYHRVADLIVPLLHSRPITMERFPKGLGAKGFYHKHAPPYFPKWIERADLHGGEDRVVYALCNLPETVVYMANQNTVAFHAWTSRHDTPHHPDQLIFDLDPPADRFDMVVETALALRALLASVGMAPYVKTSGSKGLHVVVGLDGKAPYPAVQAFAAGVAARMVANHPNLCTTEFYKKDRGGRLFIDTLRNAYGATAVAAYSLRAKPAAPISAPLTWQEVGETGLTPDRFHLGNIDDRLAQAGDLWRDIFGEPASIDAASDRLARH